jgi:hypothetical protein
MEKWLISEIKFWKEKTKVKRLILNTRERIQIALWGNTIPTWKEGLSKRSYGKDIVIRTILYIARRLNFKEIWHLDSAERLEYSKELDGHRTGNDIIISARKLLKHLRRYVHESKKDDYFMKYKNHRIVRLFEKRKEDCKGKMI